MSILVVNGGSAREGGASAPVCCARCDCDSLPPPAEPPSIQAPALQHADGRTGTPDSSVGACWPAAAQPTSEGDLRLKQHWFYSRPTFARLIYPAAPGGIALDEPECGETPNFPLGEIGVQVARASRVPLWLHVFSCFGFMPGSLHFTCPASHSSLLLQSLFVSCPLARSL